MYSILLFLMLWFPLINLLLVDGQRSLFSKEFEENNHNHDKQNHYQPTQSDKINIEKNNQRSLIENISEIDLELIDPTISNRPSQGSEKNTRKRRRKKGGNGGGGGGGTSGVGGGGKRVKDSENTNLQEGEISKVELNHNNNHHNNNNNHNNGNDNNASSSSPIELAMNSFICKKDSMLRYVTSSPPTKAIMFIISHNNDSDAIADQYRSCQGHDWIFTARLPKSIYFESIIYETFFPSTERQWEQYDYVITATYKTLTRQLLPRYMPLQTMNNIKQMIFFARDKRDPETEKGKYEDYDIYPFFRDHEDMIPTSIKYHGPNFLKVWNLLLQELGYSRSTIQKYYFIKGFYRNAFMIKPKVLKHLMKFMAQAKEIAETNHEVKELLSSNSYYVLGKKEIALEVFNTTYYQLYPFVFERLPVFFMYANHYKVCIGPDTPCKYNYKG